MYDASLADLSLPERIAALTSLTKYGPLIPTFGVIPTPNNSWSCECGNPACRKPGKHPRVLWRTRTTRDSAQIAKWAAKWPLANWAIVTGVDIDVVDLDAKPGKPSGIVTVQCWQDNDSVTTPDSTRVTTGSGQHIYFAAGSGLKTTSNSEIGIDVRSTGGYVMAPGSRHANGTVYEIDLDEGLEACPEWLVARISCKSALQQNQQDSINPNNSYSQYGGRVVEAPRFQIRPDAQLSVEDQERLNQLLIKLAKFRSTWNACRATSPWPFKDGRNSPSEYEAAIAFFLVWAGWSEQEIMDCIVVWRRLCGLSAPAQYGRYAITIGKAVAMVTPRSKGSLLAPKESKGCWKHGYTRDRILGCIIDTPRSPKQIAEVTGITPATVYVVLGRLAKDNKVIRDNHTYLCAPDSIPAYLQNIPDDAGEATGEELAVEYAEWVAAGMPGLDAVEEEIEAPVMFTPAAAVRRMSTLPDFDMELEAELVTVEPALRVGELSWSSGRPAGKIRRFSLAALKRESKEKRRAKASRFLPCQVDLDIQRLNEDGPGRWED